MAIDCRSLAFSILHAVVLAPVAIAQCTTFSPGAYSQSVAAGCGAPVLAVSLPPRFGLVTKLDTFNLDMGPGVQVVLHAFKLPPSSPPAAWTSDVAGFPLVAGCFNHLPDAEIYRVELGFWGSTSLILPIPATGVVAGTVVRAQAFQLDILNLYNLTAGTNSVCLYLAP